MYRVETTLPTGQLLKLSQPCSQGQPHIKTVLPDPSFSNQGSGLQEIDVEDD